MGVDLEWTIEQNGSIQKAINTRKFVLVGSINLIQGGVGFVNRNPISIAKHEDQTPESSPFLGFMPSKIKISLAI